MNRIEYDLKGWSCLSSIMNENNKRLSRTRHGKSDTSTSPRKRALLLAQEELSVQTVENERTVHQFLYQTRHDPAPRRARDVLDSLWTIADRTNAHLLPTADRLRQWPMPHFPASAAAARAPIPPEGIEAALEQFAETIHQRWHELDRGPVPLAAWAIWELNGGPMHPFYDGCGRISRAFGALLLVRGGSPMPLFQDRDTYFAHGHRGDIAFSDYVSTRIAASSGWLEAPGLLDESASMPHSPEADCVRPKPGHLNPAKGVVA